MPSAVAPIRWYRAPAACENPFRAISQESRGALLSYSPSLQLFSLRFLLLRVLEVYSEALGVNSDHPETRSGY